MKKKIFANLFLVFFSLFLAFSLSEFGLRFLEKMKPKPVALVEDDILKYRAVPETDWNADNMYLWDANGFRNPSVPEKADVVAMGDSTTVGFYYPVEKSWPAIYGQKSNQSVYQIALPNYSIVQYSYLLDKALELDPKTVVVAYYMGNDLYDTYEMVYTRDYWKHLRSTSSEYQDIGQEVEKRNEELQALSRQIAFKDENVDRNSILKARIWLRDYSRVYALLADASYGIRVKLGLTESQSEKAEELSFENPELSFYYKDDQIATILSPNYRLDAIDLDNKAAKEGYRITWELLADMDKRLQEKDKKLQLLLIPSKEIVYGRYMHEKGEEITMELEQTLAISERLLAKFASSSLEKSIPFYDTTDAMVKALHEKKKIFPETLNSHPTDVGYEVIADGFIAFQNKE